MVVGPAAEVGERREATGDYHQSQAARDPVGGVSAGEEEVIDHGQSDDHAGPDERVPPRHLRLRACHPHEDEEGGT